MGFSLTPPQEAMVLWVIHVPLQQAKVFCVIHEAAEPWHEVIAVNSATRDDRCGVGRFAVIIELSMHPTGAVPRLVTESVCIDLTCGAIMYSWTHTNPNQA